MEDKKIKAIKDWKFSSLVIEMCSFLILANYYQRSIEEFSKGLGPLIKLVKKDKKCRWALEYQVSFTNLKKVMMEGTIVGIVDVMQPFEVDIDALDLARWVSYFKTDTPYIPK